MGFMQWQQAIIYILLFAFIIAVPCMAVTVIGTRMVNDIGNFPTKAAQIQSSACWKVLIFEIISFFMLAVFFHFFS